MRDSVHDFLPVMLSPGEVGIIICEQISLSMNLVPSDMCSPYTVLVEGLVL